VGFDKEFPLSFDDIFRVRTMNLVQHLALEGADMGLTPTHWQRSRYPQAYQPQLRVLHEGIDTNLVRPDPQASLHIAESEWKLGSQTVHSPAIELKAGDEVLTFTSRSLEPYRGIHSFLRALPHILQERPNCQVLVLGKLQPTYGPPPRSGGNWRDIFLNELVHQLSPEQAQRIHFAGPLPYEQYLQALRISSVHVYLTYPFILSWSLLEAMACGCLVMASDTAPVQEVLQDGMNGLLVPFHSHQALAGQVVQALAHPQQYAKLRQKARTTVCERFDFERVVLPQHLHMLEQLSHSPFEIPDAQHDEALH
jgi:glycosyltransferase involved in cell wall biosynthesis